MYLFIDRGLHLGLEHHLGHELRANSQYVNLLFIYLFIYSLMYLFIDRGLRLGLEHRLGHELRADSQYVNLLFICFFRFIYLFFIIDSWAGSGSGASSEACTSSR